MLRIYDKHGNRRMDISPGDSSTLSKEIQGDSVLTLSFVAYDYIELDVGDYAMFEGEQYYLTERYVPAEKSTMEWTYDVRLYGVESIIKRFLVLETIDGRADPEFTLTATPREHVAMIVKCINDGMNHATNWKVGNVVGTDLVVMDYEGKYCDEALRELAEKVGGKAEWWIDGQTINVCRCERGERISLGYGEGLQNLERGEVGKEKFYTRLFPIGSSRNIDPEDYGFSRLTLPYGKKSVELHTDEYGIYDHYEREAFSHIYPRRIGKVSSVRSYDTKDQEGNPMTIYYFKDNGLSFNPNDYEMPGAVKRISFQTGDLAGLGSSDDHYFEANYDESKREFELINIYPYDDGKQQPGGMLVPREGDEYILWNIKMPKKYYKLAEDELYKAVQQYNYDHWRDISVYSGKTDHVWVEENECQLYVGRRVRLNSSEYFPKEGYRDSRITKITQNVNLPSMIEIEISDALHSGALRRMAGEMGKLKAYTKSKTEAAALPDIIRSTDSTLPTDNNLFSARRSEKEFLSKTRADSTPHRINFDDGIGLGRSGKGITGDGDAVLGRMTADSLTSAGEFVDGLLGSGYKLWKDDQGKTRLTLDRLTVRETMVVMELLIEKVRAVGGQLVVSAASGKIKTVEETTEDYKLSFENGNTFREGDLIRCSVWTAGVKRDYWTEVKTVDGEKVVVSKTETAAVPMVGDDCVLMGNTLHTDRQNLILISATEDGEPRVDVLSGVHTTNFNGCLRARLGNLDGIRNDAFAEQPKGDGLYADNAYLKGTFVLETGEDVKTRFEIAEGKMESEMAALRNDFVEDKGYLSNPSFARDLADWDTANEAVFFLVGNRWVWANDNVLSSKGNTASMATDMNRRVVRIQNRYIRQANDKLKSKPKMEQNAKGEYEPKPVFLSFFYRCTKGGQLKVEFENVDKTGFVNFNSLYGEEELQPTEDYRQYSLSGLWNGTGDFRLSFTGDIYVYMLVLTTDKVESLTYKYKTLFEQSERLVKLSAAVYDKDENALRETGLFVKPEGSGIYAQDNEGNVALVGAVVEEDGKSKIMLTADNIKMEGLVTANGNFKILPNGDMDARGGKIGGFEISEGHLGVSAKQDDDGKRGDWANLSIYKDFFKVGGKKGYVMFGDDVIPSSCGGAFTASGRIVNKAPNTFGSYGFDQANYGLFIDVSGGTKNYGIDSNAALRAPAFINTSVGFLNLNKKDDGYKIDFSQHHIFLVKSDSYINLILPEENSVAWQFGLSVLPNDFGAEICFKIRPGSEKIRISGLRNYHTNEDWFELDGGDVMRLLITKVDGFRYDLMALNR